jgi:hypothetical protein
MFGGGGLKWPRPRLGCSAIGEEDIVVLFVYKLYVSHVRSLITFVFLLYSDYCTISHQMLKQYIVTLLKLLHN